MAIALPLSVAAFADNLRIQSVRWMLRRQNEYSGLGDGQTLGAELAPPLWTGDVTLVQMPLSAASQVQALIEASDEVLGGFYLYNPRQPYPQADPDGSILGAATPTIHSVGGDSKSLRLAGLPAGYVVTRGDCLAFDHGSPARRAFHRIVETATADGVGVTPAFEVRPHLRPGAANGLAVSLVKPAARVFIVPGSFDPGVGRQTWVEGMRFDVMQRI